MLVLFVSTIAAYALATFFRVKEKVAGHSFAYHATFSLLLGLVLNLIMSIKIFGLSDTYLHYQGLFISGALSLGICTLAIEKGLKETYFSIFTLPAVMVLLLCATFVDGTITGTHFLQKWFALHLFLAILGECFFFIAAISSITYFFVVRRLKQKNRLRAVFFFPPLTRLDDLTFKLVFAGNLLFFCGLAIGLYGNYSHFSGFSPGPKHVFAGIVFLFYAVLIACRKPFKIAGTRLAAMALAGFFLSIILITVPDNTTHWQPLSEISREAGK